MKLNPNVYRNAAHMSSSAVSCCYAIDDALNALFPNASFGLRFAYEKEFKKVFDPEFCYAFYMDYDEEGRKIPPKLAAERRRIALHLMHWIVKGGEL